MSVISDAILFRFEDDPNSSDGTIQGQPTDHTYEPSQSGLGKAISLNATGSSIPLSNSSDLLDLGPDFSVAGWVYIPDPHIRSNTTNTHDHTAIFSNQDSHGVWSYFSGFFLSVCNESVPEMGLPGKNIQLFTGRGAYEPTYAYAYTVWATPENSFPYNEWVHVAMTISGSDTHSWEPKIYINGVIQALTPRTNQPLIKPFAWSTDQDCVHIGGIHHVSHPSPLSTAGECKFDEIGIWKRELSVTDIQSLLSMDYLNPGTSVRFRMISKGVI